MSTPVQTAIGAFVWHDHASNDPQKAQQFYTELFGWGIEMFKTGGDFDYPMIVAQGTQHGGFGPTQGGGPPHWLGHVLVDDVDATADRAKSAGGSVVSEPMDIPEVGRFAVISDPESAVVSAYRSAGEWTAPEGVFVWDELYANDVDAAKRFYSEVFGWTTSEMDMSEGGTYTIFSSGDQQRAGAMTLPDVPPHWMVYVGTDDVDRDAAKVKKLGGQIYREPWDIPTVGRLAIVADPTGVDFGLIKGEPQ